MMEPRCRFDLPNW